MHKLYQINLITEKLDCTHMTCLEIVVLGGPKTQWIKKYDKWKKNTDDITKR